MRNAKPIYRHVCQICQCFCENNAVGKQQCHECGAGIDNIFVEKIERNRKMENEHVDLIASGYEWDCLNCEAANNEIEITEEVQCYKCGVNYQTNPANHAVG